MKEEMDKLIKEIYQIRLEMNYSAVKMSNDPELEKHFRERLGKAKSKLNSLMIMQQKEKKEGIRI